MESNVGADGIRPGSAHAVCTYVAANNSRTVFFNSG